jgi:hypothetical protein
MSDASESLESAIIELKCFNHVLDNATPRAILRLYIFSVKKQLCLSGSGSDGSIRPISGLLSPFIVSNCTDSVRVAGRGGCDKLIAGWKSRRRRHCWFQRHTRKYHWKQGQSPVSYPVPRNLHQARKKQCCGYIVAGSGLSCNLEPSRRDAPQVESCVFMASDAIFHSHASGDSQIDMRA